MNAQSEPSATLHAERATSTGWSPKRSTSCAKSPAECSKPGAAVLRRQGFGRACCAWPRRRSGPARFPFPLLHIDTGHNFPEVIAFRDRRVAELGERLIVRSVEDSIKRGTVRLRHPQTDSRNAAQVGDAARSDRRIRLRRLHRRRPPRRGKGARQGAHLLASATNSASGIRRHQRPELWDLYNTRVHPGEHMRVFPISNWTELDVWQYIEREKLDAAVDLLRAPAARSSARNGLLVPVTAPDAAARRRDGRRR